MIIKYWEKQNMQKSSTDATWQYDEHVPVLIVGGSLVGLSASVFLSWYGVRSLLVERHAGISPHARAGAFNARTMEIFRIVGIQDAIQGTMPSMQTGGMLRAESLAGKELGWLAQNISESNSEITPVAPSFISQSLLEPILQKRAIELHSDLRFNTQLLSFEQDENGVQAIIQDRASGEQRRIYADYMIGADGNRSAIREQLAIAMHGPGVLGHQISLIFQADLRPATRGRRIFLCFVVNPKVQGVLGLSPDSQYGGLIIPYYPEKGECDEDFNGERGIEVARAAVGQPDLPVKIISAIGWRMAALVAERFQQGRIFLVGDSAHVMPPTGGLGANTGISDAYNLAWKLAAVRYGYAGSALLASYDVERRPVAEFTVEQAYARYLARLAPITDEESANAVEEVDHERIIFGYRYQSSAILADPSDDCTGWLDDPCQPSACPGTRAPHVVLEREGEQVSTLDLFGQHFVLLIGSEGDCWQRAAHQAAEHLEVVLAIYQIGGSAGLVDKQQHFLHAYGITPRGAVLVRPDGYIAWRARETQMADDLEQVLSLLLFR
jgi:putative polyketide hydroxylase